LTGNGLNYDSDEDKDGGNELISLDNETNRDRSGTAAEKIPKLRKPKK
jgi:hypothetical protein